MNVESLPGEEWRPVVGNPRYVVSNMGRLVSFAVKREGLLRRPTPQFGGYVNVQLRAEDGSVTFTRMHVVVAEAFLGPKPSPEMQVRHLNGDPADNRLSNLAWGTPVENAADTRRHGRNWNASRTHCKKGHPFDLVLPHRRRCLTCLRASQRAYKIRQAQRAAGIREAS